MLLQNRIPAVLILLNYSVMFKDSSKSVFIATRKDKSPNLQQTSAIKNSEAAPEQHSSNLDRCSLVRKERLHQMGYTYPLTSPVFLIGREEGISTVKTVV